MNRDLNVHCLKGHRLSYNTFSKVQTQGSKNFFHSQKPKLKDPKLAPSYDNMAELPKKDNRKDKKKKFRGQKREHIRERKNQTPVTSINITNILKKKKKRRDVNMITCFNCHKKDQFTSNCTKLKN